MDMLKVLKERDASMDTSLEISLYFNQINNCNKKLQKYSSITQSAEEKIARALMEIKESGKDFNFAIHYIEKENEGSSDWNLFQNHFNADQQLKNALSNN